MKRIKIKTIKGFASFTQRKAAEMLGISESYLSLLLANKRRPSLTLYLRLKRAGIKWEMEEKEC
jgi:transcriptional regulator with XRE-family HTH domain